jgi:hypothetical protein
MTIDATVPPSAQCAPPAWPMQRILFLLAGTVTLTGVVLSALASRWFLLIPAMVGANQLLMVATGWCPVSLLLKRYASCKQAAGA